LKRLFILLLALCMTMTIIPCNASGLYEDYTAADAVQYAGTYWSNYNSDFPAYSSDCANFVSQCLYAGGMVQTNDWHMREVTVLGLHIAWDTTNNWTVALDLASYVSDNFAFHHPNKNSDLGTCGDYRSPFVHYLEYIHPGDVVLYQWKTGGYHVALVTQSSWLMGTNITQHTTDRENVSFNYAYILSYDDACETRLWQHAMSEFTWQGV